MIRDLGAKPAVITNIGLRTEAPSGADVEIIP